MKRDILVGSLILLALLTVVNQLGMAQLTSGNVIGTVLDTTGAAVPNAIVEATNVATGVKSNTVTSGTGLYRFDNLPVGTYDVGVSAQGFTTTTLSKVVVELNKTATANVSLAVGRLSTTVEVTEAASTIDTTTAQIQTTYDSTMSADMGIVSTTSGGSGILNLSLLGAGVANAGGVGVGTGPSVGGQRPRNNNFTIEGIDNNEKSTTGSLVYVPNDAVGEFTLLQNQFSAEFGHSSGGQFNTIIKSGTNSVHGTLYDYLQNRNLNAVDQSAANSGFRTNPRFDENRLGASVGGPIIKNKLFYYGLMEYNPIGQASPPASAILAPTAAGYAQIAALPGINQTNLSMLEKYLPATSAATSTIDMYPPNAAGTTVSIPVGVYNLAAPNYSNSYYVVGAVDYNISEKDQLRGRFLYNKDSAIDTAAVLPQFFSPQPTTLWLPTISEYHTFSPTLTNELRLGFNRFNQQYPVPDIKYPGLDQFPSFVFYDLGGAPLGPDPNAPQYTIQDTYQITENLSWVHGAHTFKFGFDGRKYISPATFTQRSRGDYEYSYVSDYLFDQTPDYIAQRSLGNPVFYGDQISTYLYGADTWKVNQHLTLDLGLRWEFTSVPYSERSQTLNDYASVPGVFEFKEPQPQYKNFAPRIGIAYSPGTSGRTSIRAGFGINYDVIFDNIGILDLPPQLSTTVDVTAAKAHTGSDFLKNGGILPSASTGPQLSVADARAATAAYIPDQKLPYSIQWNFGVQHVFAENYTFEARYLGTRGVHLDVQDRIMNGSPVTAANALPLFMTTPTAAQLSAIPNTLYDLENISLSGNPDVPFILPKYANAGFTNPVLAVNEPIGNSTYNGLALQMNRRFTNGFQMIGAYTWSHNIDDSTADFHTTALTPRRPQDFQNMSAEKASSALDRRQRLTLTALYDVPLFRGSNSWLMKNVVGNWQLSGFYTYETPEYVTAQSALDANLNGDTASDRVFINPKGVGNTGSDVFGIDRSGAPTTDDTQIVAYMPVDANAKYIRAGAGQLPNGGRNTLPLRPTNNVDFALLKRFSITERAKLQFQGQFSNLFNHPQYTGGYLDHVDGANPALTTIVSSGATVNMLIPGTSTFNRPDMTFLSNARSITVAAKVVF
jgi:hypothetical protein